MVEINKKSIIKIIDVLELLAERYGYETVEIAKAIFDFYQDEKENITNEQIEEITNYIRNDIEEIYDENVKIEIDKILNR